jgi:hypothetical protein
VSHSGIGHAGGTFGGVRVAVAPLAVLALLALLAGLLAGCGSGDTVADRAAPGPKASAFWPQPEGYDLDLSWDGSRMSGSGAISLRNTGPRALDAVWLRTWPNAYASCASPLARVTLRSGGSAGAQRHGCTALEVRLAQPLAPGSRTKLGFDVSIRVPRRVDRFGRSRGAAYLGSALPTLAVADREGWRLPPYAETGEAWFTLNAPWRVKLAAPDADTVATTGVQTSPGIYTASARDFALAIGDFRVTERRAGAVRLRHFALPVTSPSAARRALDWGVRALAAYTRWYGPLRRPELDIVDGPTTVARRGLAMEYADLVLTPPNEFGVAHELAHQWFAFRLGNDPWREPWLDESFAEWSSARVLARDRLGGCRTKFRRPSDPPITAGMERFERTRGREYTRSVYLAGGCAVDKLAAAVGRDRFDAALRAAVREHGDETWTRADFEAALERVRPGARALVRKHIGPT